MSTSCWSSPLRERGEERKKRVKTGAKPFSLRSRGNFCTLTLLHTQSRRSMATLSFLRTWLPWSRVTHPSRQNRNKTEPQPFRGKETTQFRLKIWPSLSFRIVVRSTLYCRPNGSHRPWNFLCRFRRICLVPLFAPLGREPLPMMGPPFSPPPNYSYFWCCVLIFTDPYRHAHAHRHMPRALDYIIQPVRSDWSLESRIRFTSL